MLDTHRAESQPHELTSVQPQISIVIPTFNEAANIPEVCSRISDALEGIRWEVIVVDDNSPDGTAGLAKELAQKDSRIRCLRRVNRRGLSGACIEGMSASAAPYVAVMDGDLQHDERILKEMLRMLQSGKADLVVGSRRVAGGAVGKGLSDRRKKVSEVATMLARMALRTDVNDLMSGFFAIKRECFDRVAPLLAPTGFKILLDIVASSPAALRTAEVGYTFRERVSGESKLDIKVVLDFVGLLVNKLTRGFLPTRFVLFGMIGAVGVVVHLTVLRFAMHLWPSMEFGAWQAIAVLAAMTSNFFLNNQLTYRAERLRGTSNIVSGLLIFYTVCFLGAVANVGIGQQVFQHTNIWWLSGLAGVLMGSVWNYALTSIFIWSRHPD